MEFKSGRTAEIARSQLREASRSDAIALDRLAVALSISMGSVEDESGRLDAADGTRHDLRRIDRFDNRALFRPILCSLNEQDLSEETFRNLLRRHLNRGYDVLYRAFEANDKDWHATLERLSPRLPGGSKSAGSGSPVKAIDLLLGTDLSNAQPMTWAFNQEGGSQTNSNVRVAGMPGVGKSQVVLNLLCRVRDASPETGFILFDYKGDLAPNTDFLKASGARVIRPGEESIPINPFQLPDNVNQALAPRIFAETFKTLSPRLGPVQEARLVRAMERCFGRFQTARNAPEEGNILPWPLLQSPASEPQSHDSERTYPTLDEIVAAVEEVYEEEGLAEDAVLATLQDLTRYNLFADHCERPLDKTFTVRWVVDLASLSTLRDFVAFVIMEFLHQVTRSMADAWFDETTERRTIRGIVAIDEAHYYLKARCRPLLDLIRIGRSKGIPVFLSSQSLEDFKGYTEVNEFLPNTFVFKHGLPPDNRIMAGSLHTSMNDAKHYANQCTTLDKFQALANIAGGKDTDVITRTLSLTGFWERNRKKR